jgi:hypothetical protein
MRVEQVSLQMMNMTARMPFRYGIAKMTVVPHVFLRVLLSDGQRQAWGMAADHLPPKWFTKNPATPFRQEINEMLAVHQQAMASLEAIRYGDSVFDLWWQVYQRQRPWATERGLPPLLAGFGPALVERALMEAYCRLRGHSFHTELRGGAFGLQLGLIHPELRDQTVADLLPAEPLRQLTVRHTVGLSDPLTPEDISPGDRVNDGLPQSLLEAIRHYGLTHFKIKLMGDAVKDQERLTKIAALLEAEVGDNYAFTLDGNEQYQELRPFRQLWEALQAAPTLQDFLKHLIFVEQPLHRDMALAAETRDALNDWTARPPMIIDESDAELRSVVTALECGYVGTSHKNCKGVFKGMANACLLAWHKRVRPARPLILSGEDLCNVAPVALLQDCTVLASLGVTHAERNGHHYFAGLSMLSEPWQEAILAAHGDCFYRHPRGFPALKVTGGQIALDSLLAAPFGVGADLAMDGLTPASHWDFGSLGLPD